MYLWDASKRHRLILLPLNVYTVATQWDASKRRRLILLPLNAKSYS
jgi:hypothetical protein